MKKKTLIELIKEKFSQAINKSFNNLKQIDPDIAQCMDKKFGHYQCNAAMKLAKLLKQNPKNIAEDIIANVDNNFENTGELIIIN